MKPSFFQTFLRCNPSRRLHWLGAFLAILPVGSWAGPLQREVVRLYVDDSLKPDSRQVLAHNFCILDPDAETDFASGRALGHTYLARLRPLETALGTDSDLAALELGLVMEEANPQWNQHRLNPLHPEWRTFVVDRLARTPAQRGFAGYLIDLGDLHLDSKATRQAVIAMVGDLKRRYPDKKVVLQDAHLLWEPLAGILHGVLLTQQTVAADIAPDFEQAIRGAQGLGFKVFAVGFGEPRRGKTARQFAKKLIQMGCPSFVTTAEMKGRMLAPLTSVIREVVVVHGWDPEAAGRSTRDRDQTWTTNVLAPALAELGVTPRWVSATEWQAAVTASEQPDWLVAPQAVIFDPNLILAAERQMHLANWVHDLTDNEIPIVLCGQPWSNEDAWKRVAARLGLGGSGQITKGPMIGALRNMNGDALVPGRSPRQRTDRLIDLQAPAEASLITGYRSMREATSGRVWDNCFLAAWGGVWMPIEPDALTNQEEGVDPRRFLAKALFDGDVPPIADASSLSGRQIYLSTVQGAGFCELSSSPGAPLCADLLHTLLQERPELPITVSVSEADVRGWSASGLVASAAEYHQIARKLFALPQVEAAANSFSRPTNWGAQECEPGPLSFFEGSAPTTIITREVVEPMAYIHRQLLPAGKTVAFMMWPEGAAPSKEAIDLTRQLAIPQIQHTWKSGWMLGSRPGNSREAMSHRHPINNPLSNSNDLAREWIAAQESAQADGWRGPVHVALSFADLQQPRNVEALRIIWEWCAKQPFYPLTASQYARLMDDAQQTRIHPLGENHWLILNEGKCRTIRLPAARGVPDMTSCVGVAGYRIHGDQIHVHLRGDPVSEIVLRPAENSPLHLRLVEADRMIRFQRVESNRARFRLESPDAAEVILGGLQPGTSYDIAVAGTLRRAAVDAAGQLHLLAPPLATVQLEPTQTEAHVTIR